MKDSLRRKITSIRKHGCARNFLTLDMQSQAMHTTLQAMSPKPTAIKQIFDVEETDITVTTPQDVQETTDRTLEMVKLSTESKSASCIPRIMKPEREPISFLHFHFLWVVRLATRDWRKPKTSLSAFPVHHLFRCFRMEDTSTTPRQKNWQTTLPTLHAFAKVFWQTCSL